MMPLVAGLVLWIASLGGFQDRVSCTVRGYISVETAQVALAREDGCHLRVLTLTRQMVIVSDSKWVLIEFSDEIPGFESFWYTWGATQAYVHGRPIPVVWGYTATG